MRVGVRARGGGESRRGWAVGWYMREGIRRGGGGGGG